MPAGGFCASRHHSLKDRSVPVQPNPVQAKFQAGLALHKQGRLAEAAKIYEDVLAADKAHVAALHCLGGVAYQMGNLESAVTPRSTGSISMTRPLRSRTRPSGSSRISPKPIIIAATLFMAWGVSRKP